MTTDMSEVQLNAMALAEGPAEPTPCVFVIGAGLVGTTLAAKLTRAGVPVAGIHGRQSELSVQASGLAGVLASSGDYPDILSSSEVIILSVRDTRVAEVAKRLVDEKRLRPNQILLHTSGSRPAQELLAPARGQVAGIGTLHPLIAVTDAPGTLDNLRGAAFGIEGDDAAVRAAKALVRMMGGRPLTLRAEAMPLYHAGAVMASNYVVALVDLARSLLVSAGIPEQDAMPALLPLVGSAVRNLVEVGLPSAMTGPAVRGDAAAIERHLAALRDRAPELVNLYQGLGQETLRIARKRAPDLDDQAVEKIAALLGGAAGPKNGTSTAPVVAKDAAGRPRI
jgi:predicted short-subunit dehydrogenase-like oxidoreductase (DUF2520 family)